MPEHYQDQWVQRGWFLDLNELKSEHRPDNSQRRFYRVSRQQITNIRPVKYGSIISGGETANTSLDFLEPDDDNMLMQCAVGLYNDFRFWMEHPSDHSMRQLDDRLPRDGYDVGMIRQYDSPYEEPDLSETEFWVVKTIADDPTFRARKEVGGPIEPIISIKANKLIVEAVTNENTVNKLQAGQLRSTPVNLKVTSDVVTGGVPS